MKFIALAIIACVVVATSAQTSTTTPNSKMPPTTTKGPQQEKFWSEMSQKQKDCFKESWKKDKEVLKTALKACADKNGGLACVKAIPQLKPCFA